MPTELASIPLLDRAQANFVEAFRMVARVNDGGAVEEDGGLVLISTGSSHPSFNPAFLVRRPADPAAVVARAQAFYAQQGVSWILRDFCGASESMAAAAASAGLVSLRSATGMLLAPLVGEPVDLPGFVVRVVDDVTSLGTFIGVLADAFGWTTEQVDVLAHPRLIAQPDLTMYLAFVDRSPVAVATRFTSHRIAGVFSVGTLPAYRRRGLGRAITSWAALGGSEEACLGSFLHPSPMAEPMYRQMGYRPVAEYPGWTPPRT